MAMALQRAPRGIFNRGLVSERSFFWVSFFLLVAMADVASGASEVCPYAANSTHPEGFFFFRFYRFPARSRKVATYASDVSETMCATKCGVRATTYGFVKVTDYDTGTWDCKCLESNPDYSSPRFEETEDWYTKKCPLLQSCAVAPNSTDPSGFFYFEGVTFDDFDLGGSGYETCYGPAPRCYDCCSLADYFGFVLYSDSTCLCLAAAPNYKTRRPDPSYSQFWYTKKCPRYGKMAPPAVLKSPPPLLRRPPPPLRRPPPPPLRRPPPPLRRPPPPLRRPPPPLRRPPPPLRRPPPPLRRPPPPPRRAPPPPRQGPPPPR